MMLTDPIESSSELAMKEFAQSETGAGWRRHFRSLIDGVRTIHVLCEAPGQEPSLRWVQLCNQSDYDALKSDWEAVGDALGEAIREYWTAHQSELRESGSPVEIFEELSGSGMCRQRMLFEECSEDIEERPND